MKILIVDPSLSYRELVKGILSTEDVRVVEAKNGEEALAYLKTETPNAISVAYELGDMDSFKFLNRLKLNSVLNNIPKFLLTSNASQEFKREAYDAGFTEIFLKSDLQTLKRALRSLMLYATTNISARVLYIEDTQSTADYTMHIMKSVGWRVDHVKSGEAAAELLDKYKNQFDLVVTDLVLEGRISGIGLINLIRQGSEEIRNIPILAVSGWNDLLRQVYVLKHGAGDFIAKPFHETDFLARAINLILNKKQLDESRAEQKALYEKANLDAGTGLNNRHFLEEFGRKAVRKAIENNEGVSLIILDVDNFKTINDTRGHAAGDAVLKQVATVIRGTCHSNDLVIRYGGDEIIILMLGYQHDEVLIRAEVLRGEIASLRPEGMDVTVSIGVASYDKKVALQLVELLQNIDRMTSDDVVLDYETLFKAADHSLYRAKEAGRNMVCMNNLLDHTEIVQ